MEMARQLKERIDQYDFCKVINPTNPSPHVCWWVLPRGRNAKQIFERLERGDLSAEESERYMKEIRRLFDKREAAMDPAIDARLSFTRSVGYSPHGVNIPAWKAVFFNPKSDRAVIDRIISSIEDVA